MLSAFRNGGIRISAKLGTVDPEEAIGVFDAECILTEAMLEPLAVAD